MRTTVAGHAISRRQLGLGAIGAALIGSDPALADEKEKKPPRWSFAPVPIPGGSPVGGGFYHIFAPALPGGDPDDAEPATITNFKGLVGLAYISGMVTRTNVKTGEQQFLPFVDTDMRFMTGMFRATDGQVHQGTFGYV
jgi:hypothetical protein